MHRSPRTLAPLLFAALLLPLGACGCVDEESHSFDTALDLAKAGEHETAALMFERVLVDLREDLEENESAGAAEIDAYKEVLLAKVESLAHTDPIDATIDFLEFADQHIDAVGPADYARVFNWLASTKSFGECGKVSYALEKAHPDNATESVAMRERIERAVAMDEVSDADLLALKSIGYLGD